MGDLDWIEGRSLDELLAALMDAEPGSLRHEQIKAAIQAQSAKLQREAAGDALTWAKLSAVSTAVATVVAVIALVVALF